MGIESCSNLGLYASTASWSVMVVLRASNKEMMSVMMSVSDDVRKKRKRDLCVSLSKKKIYTHISNA